MRRNAGGWCPMTRDYDASMVLALSDDDLSSCVGCGLCLPHCPTFRVTGDEAMSPRGRLATIRRHQWGGVAFDESAAHALNTCIQCRGCEPACPSGVPYGRIIEAAKVQLVADGLSTPWWQRVMLRGLTHHRLLVGTAPLVAWASRRRLLPRRLALGRLERRQGAAVSATSSDPGVWLFTGCVMDAWQRSTHRSVAAIARVLDIGIGVPSRSGSCCGALHSHQGLRDDARRLARAVVSSMPGDATIVVDSAGCGAALKDYGHLLGTPEAERFARRVLDVHEWLDQHMPALLERTAVPQRARVVVQDPCHLRHVQKAHTAVRAVLSAVADVVEIDDDGLCCGAGGAYAAVQPELARRVRDLKVAAIARADGGSALVVASANPGCLMHLQGAGLHVRHPVDIVADALGIAI